VYQIGYWTKGPLQARGERLDNDVYGEREFDETHDGVPRYPNVAVLLNHVLNEAFR
jgi:hypothetical protein